jgi:hypothetical protein
MYIANLFLTVYFRDIISMHELAQLLSTFSFSLANLLLGVVLRTQAYIRS